MGKIYYIMGKSSSGKDTLFRKIKQELPMLQTVTLYTTRPKREGERRSMPRNVERRPVRLNRALTRERQQEVPRYAEMCRRFLADTEDFSEEHLRAAGIKKRYYNDDQKRCLDEIIEDIRYGKF